MYTVSEIAEKINGQARELAPELLPNGHYSQGRDKWMFSGIADTGRSASAWVHLQGPKVGKWFDMGNAAPGEDKGDMLDLLRLKLGLAEPRDAIVEAKRRLGIVDNWSPGKPHELSPAEKARRAEEAQARQRAREEEAEADRAAKARGAKALFLRKDTRAIAGTPAEAYLLGRSIEGGAKWPGSLRYNAEVWNKAVRCKVPAMLAAILRADGEQIGTHRTYLQDDPRRGWRKLDTGDAKMVLGNMWGGFIPIHKGSSGKAMSAALPGEPVYVTEGIEDALVVRMMKPEARIVAAISLGNIGAIILPSAIERLVIVADRDEKPQAQEQLERSIAQQQARGLDVRLVMPPAEHAGEPVKDMNDWLVAWLKSRARQQKGVA